jgi:chemotaxis signal transduction protein/nucleoid-associated protein YgaU
MDQDQVTTLLIFQVGPYSFCVSALEVESILSTPPITTIPFAPKSVDGTCLFHEKIALVISLHQKFGLKRNADKKNDQLIITRLKSGLAAFRVDAVLDVTTLTDQPWGKISTVHSNNVFDRFLLKDGHIILHTSFETLYNLPDAAHVDDALKSLASVALKPETGKQESAINTSRSGIAEDEQLKSDATGKDQSSKNDLPAHSTPESPSLDIFDFETIPPSQVDLTGPPPGSINYSVDEHDAFDINHMRKSTENKRAGSITQKNTFSKPGGTTPSFSEKTRPPDQQRTNGYNHRRPSITGWIFLIALLLACTGTFYLWPSRPEQEKAAFQKNTYQAEEESKIETATVAQTLPPRTSSTEEAEMIIQLTAEIESITKETIVGRTPFAESEVSRSAEKPEPVEDQNEEGEIYRVENKDFALIVERPSKNELVVIEEGSKKKKNFQEYIHAVVKGDTLWAISSKYLGNPFLYNTLAENSEIRNPNIIYPGDRIRIIKKQKKL